MDAGLFDAYDLPAKRPRGLRVGGQRADYLQRFDGERERPYPGERPLRYGLIRHQSERCLGVDLYGDGEYRDCRNLSVADQHHDRCKGASEQRYFPSRYDFERLSVAWKRLFRMGYRNEFQYGWRD